MNWRDITPPPWISALIIATSVALILVAICIWSTLIVAWIKHRWPQRKLQWPVTTGPDRQEPLIPVVYAGEITVSDRNLRDDLWLEIGVHCFNASSRQISLDKIEGAIICDGEPLPPPNVREPKGTVSATTAFLIVLEQRFPRRLAEKIGTVSSNEMVEIDFTKLNIMMQYGDETGTTGRLPLCDAIRLYRSPDKLLFSRVVTGRIESIALAR